MTVRSRFIPVAIALLAIACGSTVRDRQGDAADAGAAPGAVTDALGLPAGSATAGGSGGGVVGSSSSTTAGRPVGGAATAGTTRPTGPSTTTPAASGSSASGGGTAAPSPSAPNAPNSPGAPDSPAPPPPGPGAGEGTGLSGRGVTDESILVGFEIAEVPDNPLGVEGVEGADANQLHNVMLEYINSNGGIQGRPIEPVFVTLDYASGTRGEQEQAACEYFAHDTEVAVAVAGGHREAYHECASDNGLPVLVAGGTTSDDGFYETWPDYAEPSAINLSRVAQMQADGLYAGGFYEPAGQMAALPLKIGLLYYDAPRWVRAANEHLKPGLARHNLEIAAEVAISPINSQSDAAQVAAQVGSAVLRFQTEGITNVVFIEIDGVLPFFFANAAESQGYRPRYGLTSNDGPDGMSLNVEPAQLENSVAVGWNVWADVRTEDDPGIWPGRQRCLDILDAGGVTYASREAEGQSMVACEGYLFFQDTMNALHEPITRASLTAAAVSVGAQDWPSAFHQRFHMAPDRRFGGAGYRTAAFQFGDCDCYRYTSELIPID